MRLSIKIIIFLLIIIGTFLFIYKDSDQSLPVTLHTITYRRNFFTGEGGTEILLDSIKYSGSLTINKDKTVLFSKTLYDSSIDYRSIVSELQLLVSSDRACYLQSYHKFRPIKTRNDDVIEKGPYQIFYNGDKFTYKGGWLKTTKTYFPSKKFFKCLYEESYIIDPKIGQEYEKNGWETEQHKYELLSALLAKDNNIIVQGFDGKYYSVPKEIKKHVKEWQKKHPSPPTN